MNKERIVADMIDCGYTLEEINNMGKDELFDEILKFEGIQGYATWIKDLVNVVYGIEVK